MALSNGTQHISMAMFECNDTCMDIEPHLYSGYYFLYCYCSHSFPQIAQNTTAGSGSDTEDLQLLSYGTAITITAVLCTVTSLIFGVLLGALLHHIINRAWSKPPTPPHNPLPQGVINEEVDICTTKQKRPRGEAFQLNLNEAYALVEKKTRHV